MHCDDIQKSIELYVLGGLGTDEATQVRTHLRQCAECRRAEAECLGLVKTLKAEAASAAPLHVIRRTIAQARLEHQTVAIPRNRRRRLRHGLAVAAALAFVVLLWQHASKPTVQAQPPHEALWERPTAFSASATVADDIVLRHGRVFMLVEDADQLRIAALDGQSGEVLWRDPGPSVGYLSADETRVFGLTAEAESRTALVALDQKDGRPLWRFDVPSSCHHLGSAQPLGSDCLCWCHGNTVYVLDAGRGRELWSRTIEGEQCLSGGIGVGRDLFVAGQNQIYRFDVETGELGGRVTYECGSCRHSRPILAAAGRCLLVSTALRDGRSRVLCLDTKSNRCLWDKSAPRVSHVAADGRHVYLRCQHVYALDRRSGEPAWHYEASGCSPVTAYKGCVCFVDTTREGGLVALDGENGHMVWRVPGLRSCNAFLVAGTTAYLKTVDSIVHAFAMGS